MDKNIEILHYQKKQKALKKEVKQIKKKLPTYIIGFIFFLTISLYFLEDKFYLFFGNNVIIIMALVILLSLFSLIFLIINYLKIKKKRLEAKAIGSKIYKLMRL